MKESISVRSMIDSKVFWAFSNFNTFRLSVRPWLMALLFPIFMIGMGIFNICTGGALLGVAFIVVGIAYPASYVVYYRSSITGQIKKFGLETAQNFYTCTLDEQGLHVQNATEQADCPWDKLYRAYWVDGYVYLYATKARSFILPVKDIENASEQELIAFLQAHLPAEKFIDKRIKKEEPIA